MKYAPSPFARRIIALTLLLSVASVISVALYLYTENGTLLSLAITLCTTLYHFAMRLLVGMAVPTIRATDAWWFQAHPFEARLYKALRVRFWKRHMPTYDPKSFSLEDASLQSILQKSCQAEIVHEIIMVLSFLPVLVIPRFGAAGVFWGTSILSALMDSLFVIMQRYNRPRLIRIVKKERNHHG